MAAKAPQQRNQPGRFPHCARQRVRLLWNKKRLGDRRAPAALGTGISAALLSSTSEGQRAQAQEPLVYTKKSGVTV